jgi:hypothetical protein
MKMMWRIRVFVAAVALVGLGAVFSQTTGRAAGTGPKDGAAGRRDLVLTVQVKSPNGGEVWKSGERRAIIWTVPEGADIAGVIIRFLKTAGSTADEIANLPGNPGSYEWQVPDVPSEDCRVLVEVFDGAGNRASDQSDLAFTIRTVDPRPDLTVKLKTTPLVRPNQDMTITVTVKNKGGGPAPESDIDIIVRNGHAPRQVAKTFKRTIRALDAGDEFSFSFPVKLSIGLYEICGSADRKKKIQDADRTNNEFCIMVEGK